MVTIISCTKQSFENVCDAESDTFFEILFIKYIIEDESVLCNIKQETIPPSFLSCPSNVIGNGVGFTEQMATDGNRLNFTVEPPFPQGIGFGFLNASITGVYSEWKADRNLYKITVSNSKGSASCNYEPKWMGKLPKVTGFTACYDESGIADPSCTLPTRQDEALQLGILPSYAGPSLETGGEVTHDLVTGLTWTSCSQPSSGLNCLSGAKGTYTLPDAITHCESLNALNGGLGFGGRTGWRVPEIEEIVSTFRWNASNPSIDLTYFPDTIPFNYKSKTYSNAGQTAQFYATIIQSSIGGNNIGDAHYLRCVAGKEFPQARKYIDNGNGTVLDLDTSLVWQKCTAGYSNANLCTGGGVTVMNWTNAINYCNSLNLAGKIWRLPNLSELMSLTDPRFFPAQASLNPSFFPNTDPFNYWSSTSFIGDPELGSNVLFSGYSVGANLKTISLNVRCVANH
ncbi:DUF1566 domain-containing protein [Leptospira sp. 96542]|nr:DUF1566 domain-containing protein [Leptospira sp. 96542]